MAASVRPSNPLVKVAVAIAGSGAAFLANQLLERGWSAVFGEDAPTEKATKQSAKDTKKERKRAKKEGRSKQDVADISDPMEDVPVWKTVLWTVVSGLAIQGLRLLAERGAQKGTEKVVGRRPRPNRG